MGMVVRTNVMAVNAQRQLNLNNNKVSKSLEKLASGYRINRAGDDAAGLAISERMKAQIKGLDAASNNSQDGISLIQTAEGALNEVHDMLNRMVELSTKAANGVYTESQRANYKDEVDQLKSEINRIADSTNFNSLKLLDGTMGLNSDAFSIGDIKAGAEGAQINIAPTVAQDHLSKPAAAEQKPSFSIDLGDLSATGGAANANLKITFTGQGGNQLQGFTGGTAGNLADVVVAANANMTAEDIANAFQNANKQVAMGGAVYDVSVSGTKLNFTYAGAVAKGATAADTDPITDAITSPTGEIKFEADDAGTITVSGRNDCPTYNVVNPVVKSAGQRAGATLTLDANLVKDGNKLTIEDKTFVFKTTKDSNVTAGKGEILIDVSDKDAGKQIAEAVDKISQLGKETKNFQIGAKNDTTIEIEQKVSSLVDDKKLYETENSLTSLFEAKAADTPKSRDITVNNANLKNGDSLNVNGTTYKFVSKATGADNEVVIGKDSAETAKNLADKIGNGATAAGEKVTFNATSTESDPTVLGGGLTLQVGDTYEDFNLLTVGSSDMHTAALGLDGVDISTQASAGNSINLINSAIDQVSKVRSGFGALQNRLEHTINNLDTTSENLTSANSRIRDTDMAKEMMEYTKMNVLVQSAQAMLAQANQQPQSVLQLLQ